VDRSAEVRSFLVARIAEFVGAEPADVDSGAELSSYGIDSTDLLTLLFDVEERFDTKLHPGVFLEAPSIDVLAARVVAEFQLNPQ
jgi:acyl carrier protein